MARIVTSTYRYKPPPKRKGRKLAKITGPAVVTPAPVKKSRRPVLARGAAAEEENVRGRDATTARQVDGSVKPQPAVTARPSPKRHWGSDGEDPLPSGVEALDQPFAAFPSWFLRIECDRCGKVQVVNEARAGWRDRTLRQILAQSGRMTGGFALIAWPAVFESSGIVTFIVGPDGDLYQ